MTMEIGGSGITATVVGLLGNSAIDGKIVAGMLCSAEKNLRSDSCQIEFCGRIKWPCRRSGKGEDGSEFR
jgi:hypothetical protein